MYLFYIISRTDARAHAKEEGSSNIARPPAVTLANGDSLDFIQINHHRDTSLADVLFA
jgi:hypothetical protein